MNFEEAMGFINSFSKSGARVKDLSRIEKLLSSIGNPQEDLEFVHIAGTNGKGSVLEYCSGALIRSGYKTGQFTSPFMECYCDRIRINGVNIPKQELADVCQSFMKYTDAPFSQFEISLAAALLYFKKEKCSIVFLETGVGGKLDATNIIKSPLVSVITSVSLDHTQVLGNTVEEIARQKAGIIKYKRPCVFSPFNKPSVEKIVRDTAAENNSSLVIPDSDSIYVKDESVFGTKFCYKGREYSVKMCGFHQVINAVTAIETVEVLRQNGFEISDKNICEALENTSVNSRIQVVSRKPDIIIDGGHNIAGIDSLVNVLKLCGNRKVIGVVGMMKGKDIRYAGERFSGVFERVYCVDGFAEGDVDSVELAEMFSCPAEAANYQDGIRNALENAVNDSALLIICGSLYLASAAGAFLKQLL